MFTPSEQQFLIGMAIICGVSFVTKYAAIYFFNTTLSPEDKVTLEKQLDKEISIKSQRLAAIYFMAHCVLFLNSAILGALLIKEYFL